MKDMKYTRVVLGPEAEKIANRLYSNQISGYARLDHCNALQSLFLCSIGNYVFLEVSHNGSVRVYQLGDAPIPFFEKNKRTYSYTDVTQSKCVYRKPHLHSETDSWQSALRGWIFTHCHANGMH